jgi:solute carrier family 25, member 42
MASQISPKAPEDQTGKSQDVIATITKWLHSFHAASGPPGTLQPAHPVLALEQHPTTKKDSKYAASPLHQEAALQQQKLEKTSSISSDKQKIDSSIGSQSHLDSSSRQDHSGTSKSIRNMVLSFLAGGAAGALAKTCIAPLDRLKILFQVSNIPFSTRAVLAEMIRMYKYEGISSLFRGNLAQVVRVYPYSGIQLMTFDAYSKAILLARGGSVPPSGHAQKLLTPGEKLLAGAAAGGTSVVLTYPLDLMRARLAVQTEAPQGSKPYGGLVAAFRTMYKQHGFLSFYSGVLPTLLGILPYAGISFMTFEQLKSLSASGSSNGEPSTVGRLAAGAVAGLAGQAFTYPFDVIRRRMQTEGFTSMHAHEARNLSTAPPPKEVINAIPSNQRSVFAVSSSNAPSVSAIEGVTNPVYKSHHGVFVKHSMMETGIRIIQTEGITGLFKGISMNFIKGPIGVGFSFTMYDLLKKALKIDEA